MKYIKSFKQINSDRINEELFGAFGKMFKNLWKNITKVINKIKGGKEVEAIYKKYIEMLKNELVKQTKVELNLVAAEEMGDQKAVVVQDGFKYIFEAESQEEDKDTKLGIQTLKNKQALITQIIKKIKEMAIKEMNNVLKKYGGSQKNPQLESIIESKKDQFELDVLTAQISYLEKAGDKTMIKGMISKRDEITKKIDGIYKNISNLKPVELKEGDDVIYLLKGKKVEDWKELSDEEKSNPTGDKAKNIVGVKKIIKIQGDKFTFNTEKGVEFTKDRTEIIKKSESNEKEDGITIGDLVTWTNKEGKEIKKKVEEIKGDVLTFTNQSGEKYTKKLTDVTKTT